MAIYEISSDHFRRIDETSFSAAGIPERNHLQRLLRSQIDIVSPDTLVIAEEFGQWEDCNRRIDLLGIDKQASLVVIELKRTEDGGHMELQAIRYAAMVSTMTFEKAVEVYADFLQKTDSTIDARSSLLGFLEWDDPDEAPFAEYVRIVLASADFSKELTTAVMWLNDQGLNIKCIRIKPYNDNGRTLADVQQIIPLPEEEDYRVQLKEKQLRERAARTFNRDLTKYDVTISGTAHEHLPKRMAIFTIVRHLVNKGHSPAEIAATVPWKEKAMFRNADGKVSSEDFIAVQNAGGNFNERRFYCDEDELLFHSGRTYAFTNQWGSRWSQAMDHLIQAFPGESIAYRASS